MMYRHGDLLLIRQGGPLHGVLPGYTIEPKRADGATVLLEGEHTGHAHVIKSRAAEVFAGGGGRILNLSEPADLTHEEHKPISLPPGNYEVRQQREWTERDAQPVAD